MEIASLAYRTDLIFPRFDGSVEARDGYLVIRSPRNPTFYWGNFLLFARPPGAADLARWPAIFARELAGDPRITHVSLGWDAPDGARGAADRFVAAGYELVDDLVMVLDTLPAPVRACAGLEIRALASEADWQAMAALDLACNPPGLDDSEAARAAYLEFKDRMRARYRGMVAQGHGIWLGGFLDGRLAGHLGLFRAAGPGGALARFQSVETHPDMRRRGVCRTLMAHAVHLGLTALGARRLVIVARDDDHAKDLYRAIGFTAVQRQVGVLRR